ncbi:hypothetical protein IVA96_01730 [Bradyrhizobium sp. 159]|uniref:hypothetical protein n=1 Tax=Bradyrhizobium sp. 159 TaxID=2782632 RepID=UPI001FF7A892|nr:hypothetical protein [Bradyrhizobium sp. 159]MCK1615434.1 hypothetical protein [Bradyrhizobium sp. 159]
MSASTNSLNLAWSIVLGLHFELQNAQVAEWDEDGEVTDEYWQRSQSTLGNALTLVQQGFELSLKSSIAAVNPYLLLSRDIRDWPASDKKDISFADFRTIDAADLVKLHNSICADQLEASFIELFDRVRRRRNQIIHLGKDKKAIAVVELIEMILSCVARLAPSIRWMKQRADYKNDDYLSVAYSNDHVTDVLCNEAEIVIDLLGASSLDKFFGFDKKARRYYCPECARNVEGDRYLTAHLKPNKPSSTDLFCIVCDEIHDVVRKKCVDEDCKSNVISADGVCLVCWEDQ